MERIRPIVALSLMLGLGALGLISCNTNNDPNPTPVVSTWSGQYAAPWGTTTESGPGSDCPQEVVHRSTWRRPGPPWSPPQVFTNTLKPGTCEITR